VVGRPSQAPRDAASDDGELGDEALVTLAQHDRAAFAHLYRRYAPAIYCYCDRALGDQTAAEEVTQTVFLRALTALPSCRDRHAFRPWLFAIAHNAIADARRARRLLVPLEGALDVPDSAASPEELALAGVERREITALLAHLQDQERAIIELRLAGLRSKEIAHALGRNEGAVRTAQYRAVQHLRALLANQEQEVSRVAR
jgi:RNA polymerase sigma-70 factor (ECF subfamily)